LLEQFLEVETETEFGNLRPKEDAGENEEEEINFFQWPNHIFAHPTVLFVLEGQGSMEANNAGSNIVDQLNGIKVAATAEDAEAIAEFLMGSYQTLAFLWIVGKGLSEPAKLTDPPEPDSIERKEIPRYSDSKVSPKKDWQKDPSLITQKARARARAPTKTITITEANLPQVPRAQRTQKVQGVQRVGSQTAPTV
jgi:hypothetical protein